MSLVWGLQSVAAGMPQMLPGPLHPALPAASANPAPLLGTCSHTTRHQLSMSLLHRAVSSWLARGPSVCAREGLLAIYLRTGGVQWHDSCRAPCTGVQALPSTCWAR